MKNKLIVSILALAAAITFVLVHSAKADQERRGHSTVVVEFSDYPLVVMPIEGATGSGPDVPPIAVGMSFVKVDAMLRDLGFTREHQGGLLYIYNR